MLEYILIAGVNGAGKSTLYQSFELLQNMHRVNTDDIVREIGDWRNSADVMRAGKIAVKKIDEYFKKEITFNQETTLCGKSILKNIKRARELGYYVEMHYVGVDSVEIAKNRIAYRVKQGGHGIPDKDVERRYEQSLIRLKEVLPYCDLTVLYDNSDVFRRFAIYKNGILINKSEFTPKWFDMINIRSGNVFKNPDD